MENTKICKTCSKKFLLIKMGLDFYKRYAYPYPESCPHCRHQERQKLRGWRSFYKRSCDKCGMKIITIYSPESEYIVYCALF